MSQADEIKTIKKRSIQLELSDADVERISKKAGSVGLSVSTLIEQFIGDLVDGIYTNGSDERMYAEQWFDRCCFGMFPEKTFIRYLFEYEDIDTFLENLEYKEIVDSNIKTTEKEVSTGIIEGRDGVYIWSDITDRDGKPCYKSRKEWELSQKEYIEQEKDELEMTEQEIKEIWEDFLSWTDERDLSLEDETQKVIDWKKSISSFRGEE